MFVRKKNHCEKGSQNIDFRKMIITYMIKKPYIEHTSTHRNVKTYKSRCHLLT